MRLYQSTVHGLRLLAHLAVLAGAVCMTGPALATVNPSAVFISKLHYDDSTGTGDTGECVEITGPLGTNLSGYQVLLYNGNGNALYDTRVLGGTIANTAGSTTGTVAVTYATNGIQNGAPDGVALLDPNGDLIELWSYEGNMSVILPGDTLATPSTDILVSETNATTPGFSLKRTPGTNTWTGPTAGSCVTTTGGGGVFTPLTIPEIQGAGVTSPEIGNAVETSGVVSAVFSGMGGFYIQDLAGDGSSATSDGIFVASGVSVAVGNTVTVQGTVFEEDDVETAIQASSVVVDSAGPTAVPEQPVLLPLFDLEPFEGMKIQIQTTNSDRMRVAQTYFLGRYGQLTLSSPDLNDDIGPLIQPTQVFNPSASPTSDAQLLFADQEDQMLVLDDGQDVSQGGDNPNLVPYIGCQDSPALPATRVLRAGDFASNLVGILDEGLINTPTAPILDYRLQPMSTAAISFTTANPRPTTPPNAAASHEVVGYNVENYFTTLRQNDGNARGAFDGPELARQTAKLVEAFGAMNADVVGLAELQNNAAAINMLVDGGTSDATVTDPPVAILGLNDVMGAGTYAALASPAVVGTDQIKVGFIYKPATTVPVGAPQVIPATVGGANAFLSFNRPSLAQTFQQISTGQKFTVVMNHWKSKGSNCNSNGDPDLGDLAGNCNLTRASMAQALVNWLDTDPTGSGDPDFLILGDLNSYAQEDPIDVLRNGGYIDLVQRDEGANVSGFIFDGRTGSLDYAFASASFAAQINKAEKWPINSDEPFVLGYENFFNQAGCYDGTHEFRSADHDPISIALNLSGAAAVPVLGGRGLGLAAASLVATAALAWARGRRRS